MNDEEQRLAEIESISAIFPDLLEDVTEKQLIFRFDHDLSITITLPDDYPSTSPPLFLLSGPYLSREQKEDLHNKLNDAYIDNIGFPVIFNWISIIQDFIQDLPPPPEPAVSTRDDLEYVASKEEIDDMNIQHGEVFTDRKSAFQAHLAAVRSKEDVDRVMQILKSNSKIARATHNITAYRYSVTMENGKVIHHHDCEDDGEHGASSKMLELMDRMKADNVMVVVTRWYGGIHLGPDRFRHINNLTRQILCDNNYGPKKT
ncbi:hypothetical protein CAEBREN_19307 [Caenorhabditis brenneri]|uniref:RWD domain-containing protein n=1 Tax=Caenorhabditis brenneri TaxID=135651 RepID=G0MIW3_CAEBE|nr:hypothetical protein CAEBREN_19307 [Caenorhabditis brenneri]